MDEEGWQAGRRAGRARRNVLGAQLDSCLTWLSELGSFVCSSAVRGDRRLFGTGSHVALAIRAIRVRQAFLAKLGLVLALLVVLTAQPTPNPYPASTPPPEPTPPPVPGASAGWWGFTDILFPLLFWPTGIYFMTQSNRASNTSRGSDCNAQCNQCCDALVNFMIAAFFFGLPLGLLVAKFLLWLLWFYMIPGITYYGPEGVDRLRRAGVVEALYVFLILIASGWILWVFFVGVFVHPAALPREVLERKRIAVFIAFDHWVSIYLVGWAIVACLELASCIVWDVSYDPALLRIREAAPPLIIAVMIPQVILVALIELGPFELVGRFADMQTHVFFCSVAGMFLAFVNVVRGRQHSLVGQVFIGALLGAVVALVFYSCRYIYRRIVSRLRGRLSEAELERQRSLLAHPAQRLCTICAASEANAYNSPCGHSFLCFSCAKQFQEHEGTVCNACRQPSSLVYLSDLGERVNTQAPVNSGDPLELLWGLWQTRMSRLHERRAAGKRSCSTCGKATGKRRNAINMECGHMKHCMSCASKWREENGNKCPQCRRSSVIQQIVTVQNCNICFCEVQADDLVAIDSCAHQFCVDCSMRYVRNALGSVVDQVKPQGLRCPMMSQGCSEFLTVGTVRRFLLGRRSLGEPDAEPISEVEVDRLQRFVEEACIPKDRRFFCVNKECARLMDIDVQGLLKTEKPRVECPYCQTAQCVRCKIMWHGALTCKEVAEQKNSADQGESSKADNFLIDATTKPCPKCSLRISHYHGHACHHIRPGSGCPNCGHHFCYSCLRPGRSCSRCKPFCSSDGILEFIVHEPFTHDSRCGCPICPDCRPGGGRCPQCDGSCVVCRGIVPPGKLCKKSAAAASERKAGKAKQSTASSVYSWFERKHRQFAGNNTTSI